MIAADGRKMRLSEAQRHHISYFHPEAMADETKIKQAVREPELIAKGATEDMRIYYRFFPRTVVTARYLAVVIMLLNGVGFRVTAYFTQRVKRNRVGWRRAG